MEQQHTSRTEEGKQNEKEIVLAFHSTRIYLRSITNNDFNLLLTDDVDLAPPTPGTIHADVSHKTLLDGLIIEFFIKSSHYI